MNLKEAAETLYWGKQSYEKIKLFREAWSNMTSPQRRFVDCVHVFGHATIPTFYGSPENSKKRTQWAHTFKEMVLLEPGEAVAIIGEALKPDKRVHMIDLLYEILPQEDKPWITNLFGAIAQYSREHATEEAPMSAFISSVRISSRISQDIADAYVPEIAQQRKERAESRPFGFSTYGRYGEDPTSSGLSENISE